MRRLVVLPASTVALLALAEGGARWGLGLGAPPLSVEHPTIDYMFAPNQDLYRFGNRQVYNAQGMRSASLETVGARRLVLVFGDSVINGGNLTDQADLATTRATDNEVFFGNVSAGSWGPGNHRAWLDVFGLLGAEAVIFVLSDHDVDDQPDFEPLNPNTHPTERPVLALAELVTRYLPRYLPEAAGDVLRLDTPSATRPRPALRPTGPEDMAELFRRFAEREVATCLLFHPTKAELAGNPRPGKDELAQLAVSWGVPSIDLASRYLREADPARLYRDDDDIHINEAGQESLSGALRDCLDVASVPVMPPKTL